MLDKYAELSLQPIQRRSFAAWRSPSVAPGSAISASSLRPRFFPLHRSTCGHLRSNVGPTIIRGDGRAGPTGKGAVKSHFYALGRLLRKHSLSLLIGSLSAAIGTVLGGWILSFTLPPATIPMAWACESIDRGEKDVLGQSVFRFQENLKNMDKLDWNVFRVIDCGYITALHHLANNSLLASIAELPNSIATSVFCVFTSDWTEKLTTIDDFHVMFEGMIYKGTAIGGTIVLVNCHILHTYRQITNRTASAADP